MIDPSDVTKYDRTEIELEEFLLFCIMVAGKRAVIEAEKLEDFLSQKLPEDSPFQYVQSLIDSNELMHRLHQCRISPYGSREKSFRAICKLKNLTEVTMEELVQIPGASYKTANFFLTHSREDYSFPILDTHILSWLRERGYDVPKHSPTDYKKYLKIAQFFLDEAEKLGKDIATLDLEIWNERTKKRRT